ncbi:Rho termination factor N-terminal domain-containing protein [Geobacter sp. DSM 9736]|uniref:Rho termination factor N-terminal domain-containing protein n=1 Tax=Geobacter sp. DSM 9736 TaxID=1277350 RepID=UPI000B505945|nr:Rho termination factor N-terminal domain-containing protein [Geobacter sp. DSM 9736]SNB44730.1 Rho termination factor, N-terminal domain [Geobacter sp. DSM 9736]
MNMKEIREVAAERGVKPGKLKKEELIRAIQQAEGNPACFEPGRGENCGEHGCLWREDCK